MRRRSGRVGLGLGLQVQQEGVAGDEEVGGGQRRRNGPEGDAGDEVGDAALALGHIKKGLGVEEGGGGGDEAGGEGGQEEGEDVGEEDAQQGLEQLVVRHGEGLLCPVFIHRKRGPLRLQSDVCEVCSHHSCVYYGTTRDMQASVTRALDIT